MLIYITGSLHSHRATTPNIALTMPHTPEDETTAPPAPKKSQLLTIALSVLVLLTVILALKTLFPGETSPSQYPPRHKHLDIVEVLHEGKANDESVLIVQDQDRRYAVPSSQLTTKKDFGVKILIKIVDTNGQVTFAPFIREVSYSDNGSDPVYSYGKPYTVPGYHYVSPSPADSGKATTFGKDNEGSSYSGSYSPPRAVLPSTETGKK